VFEVTTVAPEYLSSGRAWVWWRNHLRRLPIGVEVFVIQGYEKLGERPCLAIRCRPVDPLLHIDGNTDIEISSRAAEALTLAEHLGCDGHDALGGST
jgi:hypothetical protein